MDVYKNLLGNLHIMKYSHFGQINCYWLMIEVSKLQRNVMNLFQY
jgi:hypothetical protein